LDPKEVTYKIYRCGQIPFGFAEVILGDSKQVRIELKLESHRLLVEPFQTSPLGSKEKLASLALDTEKRLETEARTNWRVWTWKDSSGKTYKAWAEFGGTVEGTKPVQKDVLLRDKDGSECRIPYAIFVPADQRWIEQGRVWETKKNGPIQLEFKGIDPEGNLELGNLELGNLRVAVANLEPVDEEWFDKYKKSKRTAKPDGWDGFARYVR
jgi:hypothetical protein